MAFSKMVQYGKYVETYEYKSSLSRKKERCQSRRVDSNLQRSDLVLRERRVDNLRRVRKNFLRLVYANLVAGEDPVFCTLTTSTKCSLYIGYSYFTDFVRRLRSRYGSAFKYIVVPEFQKRGSVHFHLLIWGLPTYVIFNEIPYSVRLKQTQKVKDRFMNWCVKNKYDPREARGTRFLQHQWQRGFFDCVPTDGSDKLASYMAKYLRKGMYDVRLSDQKAYRCSGNIVRPVSVSFDSMDFSLVLDEIVGVDNFPILDREIDVPWLGRGRYKLYKV